MAVKIRLQRMGGKKKPFYRFVVMDSRNRRDGAYLDSLGNYNPIAKPFKIEVDEEKIFMWLGRGAQLSDGARSILSKVGVLRKWEARKGGPAAPEAEESAGVAGEAAETQE
jgi:small subunit ribosomal protein S16